MKFVVAPDSFKGTLTAKEAAEIMSSCIIEFFPDADIISLPIADGGEGTAECISYALKGKMIYTDVTYPDFSTGRAGFAMLQDKTAVIDMASAAGLELARGKTLPDAATTYGVGELVQAAVTNGALKIIVGLGGSATHDFGCGCAAALGARFYNRYGRTFIPVGATLGEVVHIDLEGVSVPSNIKITAICDVDNTPFGDNGPAFVYAPQKGADAAMCMMLDEGTKHLYGVIRSDLLIDLSDMKGGGAAGAMGAGMYAFLKAELKRGADTVLDYVGFDAAAKSADIVFTGEGKTDEQTLYGKAVIGVAQRTKANTRVIVVSGYYGGDYRLTERLHAAGIYKIYSVTDKNTDLASLKLTAKSDLHRRMEEILPDIKRELLSD